MIMLKKCVALRNGERGRIVLITGEVEDMFYYRKLAKKLRNTFGKRPEGEYFDGDMNWIGTFYEDCRKEGLDPFYVDDITWNDLNMDAVYKQINACRSTAGERQLYYMMRRPMNREEFEKQNGLIRMMEQEPEKRLKLQLILSRIGVYRSVFLGHILRPQNPSRLWLIIYCLMLLYMPVSVLCVVLFGFSLLWMPILSMMLNTFVHLKRSKDCENDIRAVNYCILLAVGLNRMKKLKDPELDRYLQGAYEEMKPLHFLVRGGAVVTDPLLKTDLDYLLSFFMLDLIYFEIVRHRLARYHDNFRAIQEAVGKVDAAISIASFRKSLKTMCIPEMDYEAEKPYIHAEGMVHPLLTDAVPNPVELDRSMLITGSNASGKSTYLKAVIMNALLAQTICTCTCTSYSGSPFRIYTSMALADDLLSGESYYIAELKSLKRILEDRSGKEFVVCAIDEVLRGTNTVERIAASTEVLKELNKRGILSLIATHDVELCSLAGDGYEKAHFEEHVTDSDIVFDYQIKPGAAVTRNAIRLLKLMGFDNGIVDAAHKRADRYMETGKWSE